MKHDDTAPSERLQLTDDHPAPPEAWQALPGRGRSATLLSTRRARRWSLTLEARAVPCRVEQVPGGWQLLVPVPLLETALEELRHYEAANRYWPPQPPPPSPLHDNLLPTLSVLIALATFFNLTLLDLALFHHNPVAWVALGNADAGAIRDGQWWRCVTALTLHADWLHLLGNLTIGGVFIVRLCRDLGSGPAWCLLLASGSLGNLLNAWLQQPIHRSVGASTTVFGAVGLLAALSLVRYRRQLRRRWPLPIAAALALLALLGSEGANTDLGAHFLGFGAGIGLGLMTEFFLIRCGRPTSWLNALLALTSLAVVGGAWLAALLHA